MRPCIDIVTRTLPNTIICLEAEYFIVSFGPYIWAACGPSFFLLLALYDIVRHAPLPYFNVNPPLSRCVSQRFLIGFFLHSWFFRWVSSSFVVGFFGVRCFATLSFVSVVYSCLLLCVCVSLDVFLSLWLCFCVSD